MERVNTLINKLKEQMETGSAADSMLVTVQMLQAELLSMQSSGLQDRPAGVSVEVPSVQVSAEPPKVLQVLHVDESELAAELDEIRNAMKTREAISASNRPAVRFDELEETREPEAGNAVPPVELELHQKISSGGESSLHDRLKKEVTEVADMIKEPVIGDLRKGIGINERYVFINELFRGDDIAFDSSIKAINAFTDGEEARGWIRRELKLKLGWDEENPVVHQFDALVRRRFSLI